MRFRASIAPAVAAPVLLGAIVIVVGAVGITLMNGRELIGDEWAHLQQIRDLGSWAKQGVPFVPVHPSIPGYHAIIATVASFAGVDSLPFFRTLSMLFGLLSVVAFYCMSVRLSRDHWTAFARSLQCLFLPIAFPFHFLLYTDVASMATVLLCMHQTLRKRYALAGVLGILAIAVRQNNVLWVAFAAVLALFDLWQGFSPRALLRYAASTWTFVLAAALLAAFIAWNGGIALADEGAHPAFSFHAGNVVLFCVQLLVLFLPIAALAYPRIVRLVAGRPLLFGGLAFAGFAAFMLVFHNDHGYNFDAWWLRNKVLLFFTASPAHKAAMFLPVAFGVLVCAVEPLWKKRYALFYLFGALYLSSSWLVDPRYHFIPCALFLLFRRGRGRATEWVVVGWMFFLSIALFYGARQGTWLP